MACWDLETHTQVGRLKDFADADKIRAQAQSGLLGISDGDIDSTNGLLFVGILVSSHYYNTVAVS